MQSSPAQTVDRLQTIVSHLVREPMKDAFREVLREEDVIVTRRDEAASTMATADAGDESTADGSSSRRSMGIAILAVVGIVYYLRRRSANRRERSRDGAARANRNGPGDSESGETHAQSAP